MSQKFGRAGRGTVPSGPEARRRWVGWVASAGGVVLAVLLCVVICLGVVHDAARLHGQQDHEHPPGPHGGTVAA
ncbi:MAG: hypothetical protein K2P78_02170, partial [Gemmataceae bacterium]|nr:hypothetical protein [Gemmataceae bacterium]